MRASLLLALIFAVPAAVRAAPGTTVAPGAASAARIQLDKLAVPKLAPSRPHPAAALNLPNPPATALKRLGAADLASIATYYRAKLMPKAAKAPPRLVDTFALSVTQWVVSGKGSLTFFNTPLVNNSGGNMANGLSLMRVNVASAPGRLYVLDCPVEFSTAASYQISIGVSGRPTPPQVLSATVPIQEGHLIVPLTTTVAQSFQVDFAPQGNPHTYSIIRSCGVNVFE